jgi:hypothetical protein
MRRCRPFPSPRPHLAGLGREERTKVETRSGEGEGSCPRPQSAPPPRPIPRGAWDRCAHSPKPVQPTPTTHRHGRGPIQPCAACRSAPLAPCHARHSSGCMGSLRAFARTGPTHRHHSPSWPLPDAAICPLSNPPLGPTPGAPILGVHGIVARIRNIQPDPGAPLTISGFKPCLPAPIAPSPRHRPGHPHHRQQARKFCRK